jgi:hypothetical protein
MFVRTFEDRQAARMVKLLNDKTRSVRYFTAANGVGFLYNDNRIGSGADVVL